MPDGSVVCTKGGTQVIDRVWQHIREQQKFRSPATNRRQWLYRIRGAQWLYWNKGEDLWSKTGAMIKDQLLP